MLFQDVGNILQVEESQLRLDEGPLGYHQLVLMALTLLEKSVWEIEVDPVIWLFGEVEFAWDPHLIIGEHFIEILLPAIRVSMVETEFLDLSLVLIIELDSIQGLIGLLPHFHDKEVCI